ncbi:ABC transporter permease subunit [Natronoarchaeum rubrum]|uniref:ABC transporter permease subunit n=1 Tax=Natronoarchaeum rubrum TaxID=755311 RepID=UPI0021132027|nr:ABC transporter permease subunit [Natronoarchaeum rubrum]
MNWPLMVRKDLRDAYDQYLLQTGVGMFALLFGLVAWAYTRTPANPATLVEGPLFLISSVLVPAFAVMSANETIAAKRSDGRLRLVFGLPISRRDVVVGSYLGRAVVFASSLLAGVVAAAIVVQIRGDTLLTSALASYLGLTLLLGLAYLGIAIALSAAIRSTKWVTVLVFTIFLVFTFVWRFVPQGIVYLANGMELPRTMPDWAGLVSGLSPSVAYENLLRTYAFAGPAPETSAWFLEPWVNAVVLAGWIVLVPLLGYRRFDGSDL